MDAVQGHGLGGQAEISRGQEANQKDLGAMWAVLFAHCEVIDTDGSGAIDMEEFVSGCMRQACGSYCVFGSARQISNEQLCENRRCLDSRFAVTFCCVVPKLCSILGTAHVVFCPAGCHSSCLARQQRPDSRTLL